MSDRNCPYYRKVFNEDCCITFRRETEFGINFGLCSHDNYARCYRYSDEIKRLEIERLEEEREEILRRMPFGD